MNPRVLCVMLAAARQQMVDRAVRSFRSQSYPEKMLYVLDNGAEPILVEPGNGVFVDHVPPGEHPRTIGDLRNLANSLSLSAVLDAQIVAHWDSDDWSHPLRLAEQVELLQDSGADAVGYRELVFWDTKQNRACANSMCQLMGSHKHDCGEAWLYTCPNPKYCTGTSLVYWRRVWQKKPFPAIHTGEDLVWQTRLKTMAVSAAFDPPKMIAALHDGNTESKITPNVREWRRAPEWDQYCRTMMALPKGVASSES